MEEADSAVAVAVVSVEVFGACLRHAVAARLSDRVHLAATGLTGCPSSKPSTLGK
jgi:hypothetical protein